MRRLIAAFIAMLVLSPAASRAAGAAAAPASPRPATPPGLNDYGVAMAMAGQPARAESSFVAMITLRRGDPRALNNLGNLSLLKGELGVALAFYGEALKADTADAGIHLNRAAVHLLLGEVAEAEVEAAHVIERAGGEEQAAALLGSAPGATGRGAERRFLTRAELRELLHQAAKRVPPASGPPRPVRREDKPGSGVTDSTIRPGATRAAEPVDPAQAALLLYWKR